MRTAETMAGTYCTLVAINSHRGAVSSAASSKHLVDSCVLSGLNVGLWCIHLRSEWEGRRGPLSSALSFVSNVRTAFAIVHN